MYEGLIDHLHERKVYSNISENNFQPKWLCNILNLYFLTATPLKQNTPEHCVSLQSTALKLEKVLPFVTITTTTRHVCLKLTEIGSEQIVVVTAIFFLLKMYDRAPRSLTKPTDSTGQNVGPGSYEAAEHGRTKHGMV